MHELHLAQDILAKIKAEAEKRGLKKVSSARIGLGAGRFTHLPELQELFAQISNGIKLTIDVIPVRSACGDCGQEFNPKGKMRLDCEKCGSTNIQLTGGDELVVKELS